MGHTEEMRQAEIKKLLESYPLALDPDQVAEILGITRRTVDKLLADGKIRHFAIDPEAERKQKRVAQYDLIAYITANIQDN